MNVDEIIQAIKNYQGTIRAVDYAKVIGQLVDDGLNTKGERPHKDGEVKVQFLAEKLEAFKNQNNGTAEQMVKALKKGGIKL